MADTLHGGANWRNNDTEVRPTDRVYAFLRLSDGKIKIGKAENVKNRLATMRRKHGEVILLGTTEGYTVREREIHAQWGEYRINKVTTFTTGYGSVKQHVRTSKTDWFEPVPELMAWIAENMTAELPKYSYKRQQLAAAITRAVLSPPPPLSVSVSSASEQRAEAA